jgi:predicted tellurium resistance membrane protein TerC
MQTTNWWVNLLLLTCLEIVLSVDNLVFLTIMCQRVSLKKRAFARRMGILLAVVTRLALLLCIYHLSHLEHIGIMLGTHFISIRDVILIAGGLFLMYKGISETVHMVSPKQIKTLKTNAIGWMMVQIALMDLVFSLDSVLAAISMVQQLSMMVIAIILATGVMFISSDWLGRWLQRHHALKLLALVMLVMLGVMLVMDGMQHPLSKQYFYAMLGSMFGFENLRSYLFKKSKHS